MTLSQLTITVVAESNFTVKAHGVHTAFLEMTRGLRRYSEVKLQINSFRAADITHIHAALGPYTFLQVLFGRGKKVITAHIVPDSLVGSIVGGRRFYSFITRLLRFMYNRADAVIAVSDEVKKTLEDQLKVTSPIYVEYNTIDISRYRTTSDQRKITRDSLGFGKDEFVVLAVGQVQPRKRYDLFLKLAKSLPNYRFVWVGGMPFKQLGAEHGKLERLMKQAPSNVRNTGIIDLDQVVDYYQAADVLLHPAEQETFGLIIVEAAAAGLPIITQDLPVYKSIFGNNILAVPLAELENYIVKLATNPEIYHDYHQRSITLAKRYDSQAGTMRLVNLYRKISGKL